jgi:hypothetical protein
MKKTNMHPLASCHEENKHAMMKTSSYKGIAYNDANKCLISLWGQG